MVVGPRYQIIRFEKQDKNTDRLVKHLSRSCASNLTEDTLVIDLYESETYKSADLYPLLSEFKVNNYKVFYSNSFSRNKCDLQKLLDSLLD